MTNREASNLSTYNGNVMYLGSANIHNFGKDFEMTTKAIEKQINDRWIPVSERLPQPYDIGTLPVLEQPHYLIQRANGLCAVAKYEHIYKDCWINEHSYIYDDVVAWRELPELYVEEEIQGVKNEQRDKV